MAERRRDPLERDGGPSAQAAGGNPGTPDPQVPPASSNEARRDSPASDPQPTGDPLENADPLSPSGPKEGTTLTLQSASEDLGQVGVYRVLRKVGEGGMGIVYEAEQERPLRRRVALKQIKWGMDTREVVARFESERQALALMNHPSIARVFDAGATDTGRPFFVMEFVSGVPLTQYCDAKRLPLEERLRLFMPVCEGVQHAHQKGIIHRDLKPSNVLVALQDGGPVPKIIDFGVAKATTQRLTDKSLYTGFGQVIGTPAYMSPEQAQMTGLDIDTRTDVYSLGVMLYELLTGALPFSPESQGPEELRRAVVEKEPPRPSSRVTGMGAEASTTAAEQRRTDVPSLVGRLRGDLDWIVLKALEKDPSRRYDSASELAADIARHLNHEPVLAGHPGTLYRLKKFVRRHRLGVAAGISVALALVGGMAATTLSMIRTQRAEAQARMEADTARRVQDFLIDLFKVSDPGEARGKTITAREILDRGARSIETQLDNDPLIRARMMDTMGRVYQNLGLYQSARGLLEAALDLRQRHRGPIHVEVAESLDHLGRLLFWDGKIAESRKLLEESVAQRERLLGADHPDTAWSLYDLGDTLILAGDLDGAERALQRARSIFASKLGPDHPAVAWCVNDLGNIEDSRGNYARARDLFEQALIIKRSVLPADDPDLAMSMNNFGYMLVLTDDLERARPILEEAIVISEKTLGPDHPTLFLALDSYGELLRRSGDFAKAEEVLQRAREGEARTLGPDAWQLSYVFYHLGLLSRDIGNEVRAEEYFQRTLSIREKSPGASPHAIAEVLESYDALLRSAGRDREAAALQSRIQSIRSTREAGAPAGE